MRPRIAITPGDPRGIGPEVTRKALRTLMREELDFAPVLIGPEQTLVDPAWSDSEADSGAWLPESVEDDRAAGRIAAEAIEYAVSLALKGEIHGIVTAPLHKPSLHAAGRTVPGHTEMLRDLAGVPHVGMLMAAEKTRLDAPLRVLLATTHIGLAEVPAHLTEDLLVEQANLLARGLREDWGIPEPRIALCAMNPHASDGGLFGDEEARVYAPALERLRTDRVDVTGPVPADTVFQRALAGSFDAVVAPYHDVGMAAFKTVCFGTGVNVTLGLPFVRTSPDHGTAFDIAGSGRADSSSMEEAMRLAVRLARTRFRFDRGSGHV
ncbi:MAG: 4-hydroxythreonine-4-phosphate dehydrogenase PdxA [Gemmatimonadota bacterium]|nr:4-hydroxythreonine-4-phosphate dehydrogenase PdxA [Gemmatimonadota bacterium]